MNHHDFINFMKVRYFLESHIYLIHIALLLAPYHAAVCSAGCNSVVALLAFLAWTLSSRYTLVTFRR